MTFMILLMELVLLSRKEVMYFELTAVTILCRRSASTERNHFKVRINSFWFSCIGVMMNLVLPVGINKSLGCRGRINAVIDMTLYLARERMRPRWPLDLPPWSLLTVCEFDFNSEKCSLKTQMWATRRFLLVQFTQNGISGSLMPKNSLLDHLLRYVVELIYIVA